MVLDWIGAVCKKTSEEHATGMHGIGFAVRFLADSGIRDRLWI
jgi:hypothetical protein